MNSAVRLCALAVLVLVPACAGVSGGASAPAALRGVPGFDTRDYPGDAVMRQWLDDSPYRWVGYYLPAPCYTGTTWSGRRSALADMGWGFAVIFVGEQDWAAMRPAPGDTVPTVAPNPRCTRANLSAERGAADAAAAASAAASDGFPDGTVIFLDVERVERVSPELGSYVQSWTAALLQAGRFVPGLYAHDVNTPALYALVEAEFARAGRTDAPRLWVAKASGFALAAAPADSGYPVAAVWQGVFDTRESRGGTTLNIDVNVAASADPSRGR